MKKSEKSLTDLIIDKHRTGNLYDVAYVVENRHKNKNNLWEVETAVSVLAGKEKNKRYFEVYTNFNFMHPLDDSNDGIFDQDNEDTFKQRHVIEGQIINKYTLKLTKFLKRRVFKKINEVDRQLNYAASTLNATDKIVYVLREKIKSD